MAFPVTVAADTNSCETPGKYGPFFRGSNRYLILAFQEVVADIPHAYLKAYKSTDGGNTWSEVDGAGRPEILTSDITKPAKYTCCQSTTDTEKIYALAFDPATQQPGIWLFDASTDLWGTLLAVADSPITSVDSANGFMCAEHRPGEVVLAMPYAVVAGADSETHKYPGFVVFNEAGVTWSSWTVLEYVDYASSIGWHQVPCGITLDSDGGIRVFMQQVTHRVSRRRVSLTFSSSGFFDAPWYCTSVDVIATGPGGGGNPPMGGSGVVGGGGGGGGCSTGTEAVTPLSSNAVTVGTGGASGDPGSGPSTFGAVSGGEGGAGSSGAGTGGGAGGSGTQPGGNGGDSGAAGFTGGGGGGSGSATTPGGDGETPSGIADGGAGGTGQGAGGSGGNGSPFTPPVTGQAGGFPGGGGGGHGVADIDPDTGNTGADGKVELSYLPVQGTVYDSRLWQQLINADNSLGTLEEITEGAFPIQPFEQPVLPMPLDCKAGTGFIALRFTGANGTTYADIALGRGNNADPVAYAFTNVDGGNAGSGINVSPGIAVNGANVYTGYHAVPADPDASFRYRVNAGGASSYGVFADAHSRVQAGFLSGIPEITFGTPTTATVDYNPPD